MRTRVTVAVVLSVLVLLSGAGPVAGVGDHGERTQGADADLESGPRSESATQDYKVSINNVTINTWLLRNSTVRNATVREVVIRNATTPDGSRENVTLRNVTVGEFVLDRARLKNVTAETLVVRNKSILDVPGGNFFDPNVENRTINRHWTKNKTVSGVVIDKLVIDAAIMEANASLGPQVDDGGEFAPGNEGEADITVKNGTVGEALIINGEANDWSVGSTAGVDGSSNSTDSGGSNATDAGSLSPAAVETEA